MQNLLWVALGGSLGAVARYLVAKNIQILSGMAFPAGTLFVNATGSFIIGFLFYSFEQILVSTEIKAFLIIGFLGAYTTFSTYSLETVNLIKQGTIKTALINVLISNLICLLMTVLGMISSYYLLKIFK